MYQKDIDTLQCNALYACTNYKQRYMFPYK